MSQSATSDLPTASAPTAAGADQAAVLRPAPELSIVVPTFNERANIPILVERLSRLLVSCDWEVVFVDDNSPDGTAAAARAIGATDSRVRCIRRIGRRGLAGACLEGMLSSQARYVAVMDADLQHDEGLLVGMLDCLRAAGASRSRRRQPLYVFYGGSSAGLSKQRSRVSRWANGRVRRVLGIDLTDPMSGHFGMIRARFFRTARAGGVLARLHYPAPHPGLGAGPPAHRRAAIHFPRASAWREQASTQSIALDLRFALQVTAKLTKDTISARFILFCLVGLTGIAVHLVLLSSLLAAALVISGTAQALATVGAIAWNSLCSTIFSPTATSGSPAGAF